MQTIGVIELVSFNINDGFSNQDIIDGIKVLDKFYKTCAGYNSMDLTLSETNQCMLLLKWDSKELERKASGKMMTSDATVNFKKLVNPHTVKKEIYNCYNYKV